MSNPPPRNDSNLCSWTRWINYRKYEACRMDEWRRCWCCRGSIWLLSAPWYMMCCGFPSSFILSLHVGPAVALSVIRFGYVLHCSLVTSQVYIRGRIPFGEQRVHSTTNTWVCFVCHMSTRLKDVLDGVLLISSSCPHCKRYYMICIYDSL